MPKKNTRHLEFYKTLLFSREQSGYNKIDACNHNDQPIPSLIRDINLLILGRIKLLIEFQIFRFNGNNCAKTSKKTY